MPTIDALRSEHHVWFVNPDRITAPDRLDACQALLSMDELQRQSRFRFARDRHHHLISHALVRRVLSHYWPILPQQWIFSLGAHGKPEIGNPEVPALRFNLTHTTGLVGCVVTLDNDCGIDVEKIVERHHPLQVARRMFSETEYRRLQELDGREHLEYFFKQWTLREAYVKARGIGISFPTRKLCFDIADENNIRVDFHPELGDRNENWQLALLRLTPRHIAAVAIGRDGPGNKEIITRAFDFREMKNP